MEGDIAPVCFEKKAVAGNPCRKLGVWARAAQQGTCCVGQVWCAAELAADAELACAALELALRSQAWQPRGSQDCPAHPGG